MARRLLRLLRTAFGTSFEEDDKLFIDHTLLVVSAHATGPLRPLTGARR
jgi:hypothetical protein